MKINSYSCGNKLVIHYKGVINMCENNDLHVVTEIGVFGELDVEDPTVNNVKKKNKDVNVDEIINEAIQENLNTLV